MIPLTRDTPNIRELVFSGILFRCGLLFQQQPVVLETLHQLDLAGFFDLKGSADVVGFFEAVEEDEWTEPSTGTHED